jgi:hypothetical protein
MIVRPGGPTPSKRPTNAFKMSHHPSIQSSFTGISLIVYTRSPAHRRSKKCTARKVKSIIETLGLQQLSIPTLSVLLRLRKKRQSGSVVIDARNETHRGHLSPADGIAEGAASACNSALGAVLVGVNSRCACGRRAGDLSRRGLRGEGGSGFRQSVLLRSARGAGVASVAAAAIPHSGARHGVVFITIPQAEVQRWVILLVAAGEFDGWSWGAVAPACDLDLSAPIVELHLAIVGTVESNVLGTDQVFAIRRAGRDGELDPVLVPSAPRLLRKVRTLVANALFEDLEPVTVALVCLHSARSLGHVDLSRPRVLHGGTDGELHGVRGAGLDLCDLRAAGALKGALVASEVGKIRRHIVAGLIVEVRSQ